MTVIEHINKFKVVESHYVRKTAKEQFFPSELNIQEMHRLYLEFCQEKQYTPENYDFYKRIFHRRFNLKFLKPKKDQCNKCETYKNSEKSPQIEEVQQKHLSDKNFVREHKEDHKTRAVATANCVTAAFDLEQVLLSPYGPTGAYYYSRRLKNHNLTFTEIDNMKTSALRVHSTEKHKGSCEIGTGIAKFLDLYSDKCGGQNLNRMVFVALAHAVKVYKLDFVELTYLVVGHSQNENDTAHSTIEGNYRNKTILTTDQWESTIRNAFKKNDVNVETLQFDDIIDFKSMKAFPQYAEVLKDKCMDTFALRETGKNSGKKNAKAKKIMWNSIVSIMFEKNDKVFFKYDYEDAYREMPFKNKVSATRGGKKKDEKMGFDSQKYEKPVGIAAVKKKDLLKMCKNGLIPKGHHKFYERLQTNSDIINDEVEEAEDSQSDVEDEGEE